MTLDQQPTHPDLHGTRGRGERLFVIFAAVVTVLAVGGIGFIALDKDEPAPPPSASPAVVEAPPVTAPVEEPPAQTAEHLATAAAQERYREFLRIRDAVGQGGYQSATPFDAVSVGPERRFQEISFRQSQEVPGARQIGDAIIASLTVSSVDLTPVPGGYPKVVLQACIDVTTVDIVDGNGQSLVTADRLDRSKSTVTMYQYEPGTKGAEAGGWYVNEATSKGEPC